MKNNKLISQSCVKVKNSGGGSQDNQTWQTLCEYENQTLEAFVAARRLSAKFDCPVARQDFSLKLLRMIVKLAYSNLVPYVSYLLIPKFT